MSINLLPSEEKAKIKKDKQASAPVIEMTAAAEPGAKKQSAVQGGGVLSFFKSAFARPKKLTENEEKKKAEQKIILEQKVIFEQPKEKLKPQVQYSKPITFKPVKPAEMPESKKPGFFSNIFSNRKAPTIQIEKKVVMPPTPGEDKFPAYQPIKAEKIMPAGVVKSNHPEVIKVTTVETKPTAEAPIVPMPPKPFQPATGSAAPSPLDHKDEILQIIKNDVKKNAANKMAGPSIWSRFSAWLKKIFTRKQKTPDKKIGLPPPPPIPVKKAIPEPPRADLGSTLASRTGVPAPTPITKTGLPTPPAPLFRRPIAPPPQAPSPKGFNLPKIPPAPQTKQSSGLFGFKLPQNNTSKQPEINNASPLPLPGSNQANADGVKFTQPTDVPSKPFGIDWEVNLVPEEVIEHEIPLSKILILIIVVVVSCGIVLGGWFAANWQYNNKTKQIDELNNQIAQADSTIHGFKQLQDNVKATNDLFTSVKTMLDKHVYWTKLFSNLEHYTLPQVYYLGMAADVNGTISLTARAKNYETAIKQLYVYQQAKDFVSKANISGISFVSASTTKATTEITGQPAPAATQLEEVSFSISLTVLPEIFYQSQ